MRRILVACVILAACGGNDSPAAPRQGQLIFKVDPVTCVGSSTIEYFIDGTSKGSYSASPGTTQPFTVDAGSHAAAAREAFSGGFVWPTQTVTVPANGSFTATLGC